MKVIDSIPNQDALWAADEFINYFENFTSIEDYLRYVKKEVVVQSNQITPLQDYFFNEDIHPEDMEFEIKFIGQRFQKSLPQDHYKNLLAAVSSHNNESNIPGRELRWMVFEKNTGKTVGFIRFGSPTINSKPRNLWLGKPPNLSVFNRHAAMGFVIVPSQPFGYNYLGGKLLALMCVSHFARETLNEVFEKDIAWFETTSLYGSTTSSSQYDGLKPFIRYKGLTTSSFTPNMHDKAFGDFRKWFMEKNGDHIVDPTVSGRKMKTQMRMIAIIKDSLKQYDVKEYEKFCQFHKDTTKLNEQKRFFISTYGYENVPQMIRGEETVLRKAPNYDRFTKQGILDWWRPKASRRYEQLKSDGRLRRKLELWSESFDIDILREGK